MQRPSDEDLVAYLDGELDAAGCAAVDAQIADDPELAARLGRLARATELARLAFASALREPVPPTLLRAASGREPADIVTLRPRHLLAREIARPRAWVGMATAACLAIGLFAVNGQLGSSGSSASLDTIAAYHNLFIASAEAREGANFDVMPGAQGQLPGDVHVPDLKPWGLEFQGARKLVVEGKPAFQFYYTTDKRDLGAITVTLWSTRKMDSEPSFDQRDNVNVMSWHHAGRGYAIVGHADKGYMWSLALDVSYQLRR